jgi:hypothetical protein
MRQFRPPVAALLTALLLSCSSITGFIIATTVIPNALIQSGGIDVFERVVQRILIEIQTLRIAEIGEIEH